MDCRSRPMFRSVLLVLLVVGTSGRLLVAQNNAPASVVQECATPAAVSSDSSAPSDPSTRSEQAPEPLRLYMRDGQLISHGLTVYVTGNLTAAQKPQLRLYRSHAITAASADEDKPLSPVLVAPNQQWTETEFGRQVSRTGTLLVFDTSAMSLAGKAMVRVRPLLFWDGGGCVLGEREINIGDIRYAIAWTVAVVILGLGLVLVLARAKRENPMLLLTGVDGHLALSQTQIACWTIVVGSVVLGYGMIRREIPEIPQSLIVLMGASLLTGGVAYFQDVKKAVAQAVRTGTGPQALDWRWGDLIRVFPEGRPPELSLSKAQMLFWTILLLVLFVSKSLLEGAIWAIPWELVALMGFSQAGYLAPKVAETQTPPPPANPPGPSNTAITHSADASADARRGTDPVRSYP